MVVSKDLGLEIKKASRVARRSTERKNYSAAIMELSIVDLVQRDKEKYKDKTDWPPRVLSPSSRTKRITEGLKPASGRGCEYRVYLKREF
jgi:hypothetical protein